jgi:DMSO reductase family type II enzyme heme b subunit
MLAHVLTSTLLFAVAGPAPERFFASETIEATRLVAHVPATTSDEAWSRIPAKTFTAHPQKSVRLNDKAPNAALVGRQGTALEVRAVASKTELALLVLWRDESEDRVKDETSHFADSVALEIPVRFGKSIRLPYVGMGDDKEHVTITMQRAVDGGSRGGEYVGAGFGSLTRAMVLGGRSAMDYDAATQTWRALFVRKLQSQGRNLDTALVPFALAVWDGASSDRGGNKALTSWKFVRIPDRSIDPAYLSEVAWGYSDGDVGDPARGKQLVETVCIACHRVGDKRFALESFAPELDGIGGYSTYGYLRDSLMDPSAVVVPNLNINRHYTKATPDENGAYPNNLMYQWYSVDGAGKKTSKMASFAYLPKDDINAIVAYLKTLGAEEATSPTTPTAQKE